MLDFPRVVLASDETLMSEKHICSLKDLYMKVHSSFILNSKTWKQPICSLAGDWLDKLWCLHTMDCPVMKERNCDTWHSGSQGIMLSLKTQFLDFPGGQESACQCRIHKVRSLIWEDPTCSRRLSPRAATTEHCS